MIGVIKETNFNFPQQKSLYRGKVRDVYNINDELLVMVATDRISAFDVVLPRAIPHKGRILNQIATKMMAETSDIVPNWITAAPHPNVAIGHLCEPFKVEMIIRGYLTGHAYREYKKGRRSLCGVNMPDGMRENGKFFKPIITPSTKAEAGEHDQDISRNEIIDQGLVDERDYCVLEKYTRALFRRGTKIAAEKGLVLVDTKYEFGKTKDGRIVLIDEIHTPDSSRYFYANKRGNRQLSKEFVRQWLMKKGFEGKEGQKIPTMSDKRVKEISNRYIELYEEITGENFLQIKFNNVQKQIEKSILGYL